MIIIEINIFLFFFFKYKMLMFDIRNDSGTSSTSMHQIVEFTWPRLKKPYLKMKCMFVYSKTTFFIFTRH